MQTAQIASRCAFPKQIIQFMNSCFCRFEPLKDFFSDYLKHLLLIQYNIQINFFILNGNNCVFINERTVFI